MNIFKHAQQAIHQILGIVSMKKEIDELRNENQQLLALFNEHDKAIAYMAIVHSKAFKEVLSYFKATNKEPRSSLVFKKPDDDLIN